MLLKNICPPQKYIMKT